MPASIVYERSLSTHLVNLSVIVVALLGLGLFLVFRYRAGKARHSRSGLANFIKYFGLGWVAGYIVLVSMPLFLLLGAALGTATRVTGYVERLRHISRSGGDIYRFSVAGRVFTTQPDVFDLLKVGDCISVLYVESAFDMPSINFTRSTILSIAQYSNDDACRSAA